MKNFVPVWKVHPYTILTTSVPHSAGSSWLLPLWASSKLQSYPSWLPSSVQRLHPVMTDMCSMTHTDTHCTLTMTSSHTNLHHSIFQLGHYATYMSTFSPHRYEIRSIPQTTTLPHTLHHIMSVGVYYVHCASWHMPQWSRSNSATL